MPNFGLQTPTYYAGLKGYDDNTFAIFWTKQVRDLNKNKLYFSDASSFFTGSTPNLQKNTGTLMPVVTYSGLEKAYSTQANKPYLVDNTSPVNLGVNAAGTINNKVSWDFLTTDWFRLGVKNTSTSAVTLTYQFLTQTTWDGVAAPTAASTYKVVIVIPATPVNLEGTADFQLSSGVYAGSNGIVSTVTGATAPAGTKITYTNLVQTAAATSSATPTALYQVNNRYQLAGSPISYKFCCLDKFEWKREFDKTERKCSGKKVKDIITGEKNDISLTIKEEDAIIWGLMTGQIPSLLSTDVFGYLTGYEKGQTSNAIDFAGKLTITLNTSIINIASSGCANLQQVYATNVTQLGDNDYSYDATTGTIQFSSNLAGQYVSIITAQTKDGIVIDINPLTDGYEGFLQVQRRANDGRTKITTFNKISLTMPSISADDAGDTYDLELSATNVTKGDITIKYV
jgi:hypothetical protein